MSDKWTAGDLLGTLFAGGINGYALVHLEQMGSGIVGLGLGGIVAFAVATIFSRILSRIFTSSASGSFADVIAIKSWPHLLIWGAINGIAFALLFPYVVTGTATGVLLGAATYYLPNVVTYLLAMN